MMKYLYKHLDQILLFLAVCIFLLLRFWHLGAVPSGMTWDEAAIGYNGFAIWNTHRDEWLERMPISFRSFGDYKAPLAIYLNGFFTHLFGLNLWAIRLPFALSGVLSVVGLAMMVSLLIQTKVLKFSILEAKTATVASFVLIGLSPWHILFSRVGFESGLALTEIIWAVIFLLIYLLWHKQKHHLSLLSLLLAIVLFASSFYTYHSAKLTVPILLLFGSIWLIKCQKLKLKIFLPALLILIILVFPVFRDSVFGNGLTRAGVTVFAQHGVAKGIILSSKGLLNHLAPKFLILGATDSLRHSTGQMGVLYPTDYVFFCIGMAASLFAIFIKSRKQTGFVFTVIWIAAGLLPAAIGVEQPHPNRALLALPGMILLSLIGFDYFLAWIKNLSMIWRRIIIFFFVFTHLFFASFFLRDYFTEYQARSSDEYLSGYLEVFNLIWDYHNGQNGKPKVNQIVMTSEYGQPYIYALLTGKISPYAYHAGALVKFLFVDQPNVGDLLRENALIVTGPEVFGLDPKLATETIYDIAGKVRFNLYLSQN